MDHETIDALRDKNPAWRLLRAQHASLVLAFLGHHFVEGNSGATPAARLVEALEEHLDARNATTGEPEFPRSAGDVRCRRTRSWTSCAGGSRHPNVTE